MKLIVEQNHGVSPKGSGPWIGFLYIQPNPRPLHQLNFIELLE